MNLWEHCVAVLFGQTQRIREQQNEKLLLFFLLTFLMTAFHTEHKGHLTSAWLNHVLRLTYRTFPGGEITASWLTIIMFSSIIRRNCMRISWPSPHLCPPPSPPSVPPSLLHSFHSFLLHATGLTSSYPCWQTSTSLGWQSPAFVWSPACWGETVLS